MLELAVLGLLKEQPHHGYDLRKRLRESFGLLAHLSFGSLYPALARLESAGAVRALAPSGADSGESLAAPGSLAGERAAIVARRASARAAAALGSRGTRARKVYAITPVGEKLFEQLLAESTSDEDTREFETRLVFARHLSPAARVRLLERRRFQLTDRLDRARHQVERHVDRYERAVAEHNAETIAADLAFIENLLEAEQSEEPTTTLTTNHAARVPQDAAAATTGRTST